MENSLDMDYTIKQELYLCLGARRASHSNRQHLIALIKMIMVLIDHYILETII